MKLKFTQKIVLPVLALIAIGLAASGITSYSKARTALQDSISDQINGITTSTVSMMAAWVADRVLDVMTWSTLEICCGTHPDN